MSWPITAQQWSPGHATLLLPTTPQLRDLECLVHRKLTWDSGEGQREAAGGIQTASRRRSRRMPTRVSDSRSPGPVVELWDVERPCPLLAAPSEDFGLRREPLVEAIE